MFSSRMFGWIKFAFVKDIIYQFGKYLIVLPRVRWKDSSVLLCDAQSKNWEAIVVSQMKIKTESMKEAAWYCLKCKVTPTNTSEALGFTSCILFVSPVQ